MFSIDSYTTDQGVDKLIHVFLFIYLYIGKVNHPKRIILKNWKKKKKKKKPFVRNHHVVNQQSLK